jgi:hypothetical protein
MPDIPFPINIDLLHPSFAQLELSQIVDQLSGDGQLVGDTSFAFPSQFGLWWEFTVVPPRLGYLDGPTRRYSQRMVQWRLVHTIGGLDLVTNVLDAEYDRVVWIWEVSKPTRIEFSILPGVFLNMRRVIARAPPLEVEQVATRR